MSKVWFTSDWHLGHNRVLQFNNYCRSRVLGVKTIEEHDSMIKYNLLSQVNKRDILFVLGDNGSLTQTKEIFEECKALKIHYVPGNHDSIEHVITLASIDRVCVYPPKKYKHHWITHIPIHPDELWNKKNIHGHTHGFKFEDLNYVNVCIEFAGTDIAVDFDDIKTGKYVTWNREPI